MRYVLAFLVVFSLSCLIALAMVVNQPSNTVGVKRVFSVSNTCRNIVHGLHRAHFFDDLNNSLPLSQPRQRSDALAQSAQLWSEVAYAFKGASQNDLDCAKGFMGMPWEPAEYATPAPYLRRAKEFRDHAAFLDAKAN